MILMQIGSVERQAPTAQMSNDAYGGYAQSGETARRICTYIGPGCDHVQQYPWAIDIITKQQFSSGVLRSFIAPGLPGERSSTNPKGEANALES
jgi:hypothetical protein